MRKPWNPHYASYNLWLQFAQPVGQEHRHCEMKRGYMKARKKEEHIAKLISQDNVPQRIGILAQKGVYEFHQNPELLTRTDGVQKISVIIELNKEEDTVQEKVALILNGYCARPLLLEKKITQLNSGEEGYPEPILIQQGNYQFKLFASMDCVLTESDGTIHIVDFKTGESKFDKRQIYIAILKVMRYSSNNECTNYGYLL